MSAPATEGRRPSARARRRFRERVKRTLMTDPVGLMRWMLDEGVVTEDDVAEAHAWAASILALMDDGSARADVLRRGARPC